MKAIPSYPLLKQRTVSHADTPRHGHGSLPWTEAAPTEAADKARIRVRLLATRVLRSGCFIPHRLPDPQLSPVWRSRRQQAMAYPNSLQEGSVASQQRTRLVRVMKHRFAGGDWLSPPATDPCLLPETSASVALGAANGVSAGRRRRSRPEENFGRRKSGGRRLSRGEPSCGSAVSSLPH